MIEFMKQNTYRPYRDSTAAERAALTEFLRAEAVQKTMAECGEADDDDYNPIQDYEISSIALGVKQNLIAVYEDYFEGYDLLMMVETSYSHVTYPGTVQRFKLKQGQVIRRVWKEECIHNWTGSIKRHSSRTKKQLE